MGFPSGLAPRDSANECVKCSLGSSTPRNSAWLNKKSVTMGMQCFFDLLGLRKNEKPWPGKTGFGEKKGHEDFGMFRRKFRPAKVLVWKGFRPLRENSWRKSTTNHDHEGKSLTIQLDKIDCFKPLWVNKISCPVLFGDAFIVLPTRLDWEFLFCQHTLFGTNYTFWGFNL